MVLLIDMGGEHGGEDWGGLKNEEFSFGYVRVKLPLKHASGDFKEAVGHITGFRVEVRTEDTIVGAM